MPRGSTRWLARWWKRHREATFVSLGVFELLYLFATIPVRIALLFDPHLTQKNTTQRWTSELIVLSAFDLVAELTNIATLAENARRRRWAVAAPAALALQRSAPKQRRHQPRRGPHFPTDAATPPSSAATPAPTEQAWSLNSLLPPATGTQLSKGAMALEVLAILPLEALAWSLGPNALHLLRIAKLFRLYRTPQVAVRLARLHVRRRLVQRLLLTGYTLVLRRVMLGIALCHVIACGYVALAHWQCGVHLLYCRRAWLSLGASTTMTTSVSSADVSREETCWAIEDQLVGATAVRKYARALYWSARTLTTLGYYDVAPMTNLETVFAICAQIIGAVFTTSLLAMFIFLFRHLNERQQAFMTRLDDAKEFMALSRIPDDIRQDVASFLHEEWRSYRGVTLRDVLNKLPEYLRVGLHKELVAHRLSSVGFLAKESLVFVNTLAQRVERCVYSPKDWVIEQAADGMFFVQRGTVLLVDSARQVTDGDHFADVALLYDDRADERARAQTFCELLKLPQRWFHDCVTTFYGKDSDDALERMRSLLSKSDHQAQKMKRLFGQSRAIPSAAAGDATSRTTSSIAAMPPQKLPWMLPGSLFRKRWSHVRLLALIFVAYEVPYFVMFDTATFPFDAVPRLNIQSLTSYVVEVLCTCDFVFRSRFFAFVDPASMILVTDPNYIWERYKTDGLWIDLLSVLPVSTVYEVLFGSRSMIGAGFRLLRMARLRHLIPSVQDVAQLRGFSSKAQVAFTLFIAVTLSIHLIGCLWFAMARFSLNPDTVRVGTAGASAAVTRRSCLQDATLFGNCSWVVVDAYSQVGGGFQSTASGHGRRLGSTTATIAQPKSKYTAKFTYLRSIYWAIVALTTVGYGDIVAFSSTESIFAALWGFVGGVINCAVVAAMSNLISNMASSSHHHLERMSEIDVLLAHYRVSPSIRDQIRQFYHQQVHSHKVASENMLLTGLPSRLRHRISMVLHADAVLRLPCYFLDHGNERLIRTLTGLFAAASTSAATSFRTRERCASISSWSSVAEPTSTRSSSSRSRSALWVRACATA
ncbi:hypothetical protein PINS_up009831 [Pythium insidiosum]|nr:hypothetical protein PINS_up009831 [Pythium insidiosum]